MLANSRNCIAGACSVSFNVTSSEVAEYNVSVRARNAFGFSSVTFYPFIIGEEINVATLNGFLNF